LTWRRS